MATGGDLFPLWDKRNKDQQEYLSHTPYERVLIKSIVLLRTKLHINKVLPHLLQLGAIDSEDEEHIKLNATSPIMVDRLIRILKKSQMWIFHSLVRACALTDQTQLIRELELNPDHYVIEGEEAQFLHASDESSNRPKPIKHKVELPTSPAVQQITEQAQLTRAIRDHNQGNKQTLMRRNLYDFGSSSSAKVLDTTTCHVEVDTQHEEKDGEMKDVAEKNILEAFPGEEDPPRVIRIYGQPGVGKSSLVQHIGYVKSVEFLKRLGASDPLTGGELTTMVYIAARSINGTVEQAIYDNLRCRPEDKDILWNHIKAGNRTVIGLDAIDEIRDLEVMENVKRYVSDRQSCGQGPCIIVTSRTDLCPIESQAFDRFLVAKGFTEAQGIEYVKAYLTGEKCKKVLEYLHNHREKLYPVITNPLRCHLLCALVSEGELVLDEDDDDFSILKLFILLEKYLLKREGKEVTLEESKRFHAMCMHGLMHGLREFSQDLLDKFNVVKPFLVFLVKKETTSLEGKVTYTFPHEMLYEVFAGRYIGSLSFEGKKSLLLSICCRPALRNLQRIVFEIIMQHDPDNEELLQMMSRAILILQHDDSIQAKPTGFFQRRFGLYGKLVNLHNQIQPPETLDLYLLEHTSQKQAKEINRIWDIINNAFNDHSTGLKKAKWYLGLGNGVFGHVTECLQVCTPKRREVLTKNTTEKLLPCEYKDKKRHRFVCAVGESRWAEVSFNTTDDDIIANAWCQEDAMLALHQAGLSGLVQRNSHAVGTLTLNTNKYRDLWGQPPSSPIPVVQDKCSTELNWSHACKSLHFVYSVGLSHHARVGFDTKSHKIDVLAWGLEDVKHALYQARLSALPSLPKLMFESITICADGYQDLWGQPPSSPSLQDVDAQLSEELHHWSHICKSHHVSWREQPRHRFVCAVGGSRWAEVSFNTTDDDIIANAWCQEDAMLALHQAGLSGLVLRKSHTVGTLTVNTNKYRDLWGQPPSSPIPVVQDKCSTELNWSHACKRLHFVYSVGLSHHARVGFDTKSHKIDVLAWGLEDVKHALYQARLSALPYLQKLMFESIMICADGYQDLWGQPPSSPSLQDVDTQLSGELQHWSHICKSHHVSWREQPSLHSVLAVGVSRWAEVVIKEADEEMHIHAWCPADAAEALHESMKSEVIVHEAAGYWELTCHINKDQSLWGQPALSAFTPDVWRLLLVEVIDWWMRRGASYIPRFMLGSSTPLHSLVQVLWEEEGLRCHVHDGTIGMQDLWSLVHTGQLQDKARLHTPNIVVPAGVDPAVLREKREEVLGAVGIYGHKMVIDPNFVTETGEKYTWDDG